MKHPIPDAALQQHIAVLGKTRSGKSSVMRGLVEDLLERGEPVCIVDPKGDWWGIKLAKDGKRPGYPVVIFGGEHADVPINAHAGAHVAELFATGNRPCLIDLGGWMVGERTRFWIEFASTLFKHTRGMRKRRVDGFPIPDGLKPYLVAAWERRQRLGLTDPYVIGLSRRGLASSTYHEQCACMALAGIKEHGLVPRHSIRKNFVTELVREDGDWLKVAELIGDDPKMMKTHYLELGREDLRATVNRR